MPKLDLKQLAILKLLISIDGVGSARIRQLYSSFKSFENILHADYNSLVNVDFISNILANKILNAIRSKCKNAIAVTAQTINKLEKLNAQCISYWDDDYPEILKNIYDPPLLIYVKGSFAPADQYSVAVVGTRSPSDYGKIQAEKFTSALSRQNITIVSGMARGIDSIAHKTALKNGTRTIAVIGSGLDIIYPPENKSLYYEIAENGAVISEYELGTGPDKMNFPRRNRIIAGLSKGILIVESAVTGGALQTAAYAFDQNKDIFAIPGNLGAKKSEGTNMLVRKDMARLVTTAEDIIYDLGLKLMPAAKPLKNPPEIELNMFEEKLLQVLDAEPKQIDAISASSSISISDCLVYLLSLEFKGIVKQYPGKMFSLF